MCVWFWVVCMFLSFWVHLFFCVDSFSVLCMCVYVVLFVLSSVARLKNYLYEGPTTFNKFVFQRYKILRNLGGEYLSWALICVARIWGFPYENEIPGVAIIKNSNSQKMHLASEKIILKEKSRLIKIRTRRKYISIGKYASGKSTD